MSTRGEWEATVVERLYKCPRCGLDLVNLDRITVDKKTLLVLSCPTHGKIQKAISTSFWHYSIESKKVSKTPEKFFCLKCGYPQSIESLIVGKMAALVELLCKRGHQEKQKFELSSQDEWISKVVNCIYTCPKCGLDMIDLERKTKDRRTTLILNCSVHGKVKKNISTSFWDAIERLRNDILPPQSDLELEIVRDEVTPPTPQPKRTVEKLSPSSSTDSVLICPDCKNSIQSVRCVACGELTFDVRKCENCGGIFSYLVCRVCRTELPFYDTSATCPECGKIIKNVRCEDCGELNYNVLGCDHCGGEFEFLVCKDCETWI